MKNVKLLECTLRDGGYINNWEFGLSNTYSIIENLTKSNLDIIECGFLDAKGNNQTTKFNNFNSINKSIKNICNSNQQLPLFVAMIELESYNSNILPPLNLDDPFQITGIRLTFRKSAKDQFLKAAREIIDKGYKLFVQPISTSSYTDREILDLIDLILPLKIYSLYIVDTHGSIDWHSYDLKRIFTLFNNNLPKDIPIGFHSHNNLQLSYALSCELINMSNNRDLIIDSSLLGMGRGAGNLHTEMISSYLTNKKINTYNKSLIIETIQKYILPIKQKFNWGYDIPYFLSADNKCHPNYSKFLEDQNIPYNKFTEILNQLSSDDKLEFNQNKIQQIINEY